jgi:hypothetical protein
MRIMIHVIPASLHTTRSSAPIVNLLFKSQHTIPQTRFAPVIVPPLFSMILLIQNYNAHGCCGKKTAAIPPSTG